MRKSWMAGLVLAGGMGLAAPAMAQDFSGGYGGIDAGGAWGDSDAVTSVAAGTYFAGSSVTQINADGIRNYSPNGWTGGAQIGYNWQNGSTVFGFEADVGALDLSEGSSTTTNYSCCAGTSYTLTQAVDTDWMATLRARVGVANGAALFYATGGLAVTELKYGVNFTDTFAAASLTGGDRSQTKYGWTAGVGAEWAMGPGRLKLEYLYADFGNVNSTSTVVSGGLNAPGVHTASLTANIGRIGYNWAF